MKILRLLKNKWAVICYWNSLGMDMSEMHTGARQNERDRIKKLSERMDYESFVKWCLKNNKADPTFILLGKHKDN
jgi:hypothetical protein